MAFPIEFNYESERDFTQKFVIALVSRLGYAIVINYHGTTEFGKDLIMGEIDKFAHVRYHGLQVKYKPTLGLSDIDDLIRDCRQAFKNPFRHPQTGDTHAISTFYAVNGGSISDQAVTHFFATVRPEYGDNARILDGKALLQLDRSASIVGIGSVRSFLSGLRLELRFNIQVGRDVCAALRRVIAEEGPFPMQRLRVGAISAFLDRPAPVLSEHFELVDQCWQGATMFNRIVDSVDVPISGGDYKRHRVEGADLVYQQLQEPVHRLMAIVDAKLLELGPLVPL